jgi:hypothetical protein
MLGGMILIALIVLLILIKIKVWRYLFKLLYVISWPLRILGKALLKVGQRFNVGFWRWLHRKSAKYSKGEGDNTSIKQTDEED